MDKHCATTPEGRRVAAAQLDRTQVLDTLIGVVRRRDDSQRRSVLERERLASEGVGEQHAVGERKVECEAGLEPVRADDFR
jgi:hypothetical protein